MKVLHANLFKNIPIGVRNQLLSEFQSARELDIDWTIVAWSCEDLNHEFQKKIPLESQGVFQRRKFFSEWLITQQEKYDVILVRYSMVDPYLFKALTKATMGGPIIGTIHHTLERSELLSAKTAKGFISYVIESFLVAKTLRRSDVIVGVTQEIVDNILTAAGRKKPSLLYPNGISYENISVLSDGRNGCLKIAFVASQFSRWHGLDLVLKEFNSVNDDFEIHIVGKVEEIMKASFEHNDKFVFHGKLEQTEIDQVLVKCDAGFSSFALFRQKMTQACTLKVREYLAKGLPVISGHSDAALPVNFPYYKKSKIEPISILNVVRGWRLLQRSHISQESQPYIDKSVLLGHLYNDLNSIYNQKH